MSLQPPCHQRFYSGPSPHIVAQTSTLTLSVHSSSLTGTEKKISGSVSGRKSQPSTYFVQVPANFCVFSFILNSSTYCHYFSISRSFLPQNNFGDSCEDHFHPCYRMHKSMKGRKGRKNEIKPKGKTDGS